MGTSQDRHRQLEELREALTRGAAQIFETAAAVEAPAGGSDPWGALLQHYRVPPLADEERAQIRAAQRPQRGAPVMEVQSVVDALVAWARRTVKHIDTWDDPHEVRALHERLTRLVDRLPTELLAAYRRAVLPPRGGMFGNVLANHDPSAAGTWTRARAHAFRCVTCGAPRLSASDEACPFCNAPLMTRGE